MNAKKNGATGLHDWYEKKAAAENAAREAEEAERMKREVADPWAVAKVMGLGVQAILDKCPGRAQKNERGIWMVNKETVEALGIAPELAEEGIEKAQKYRVPDGPFFGGTVFLTTGSPIAGVRLVENGNTIEILALLGTIKVRQNQEVIVKKHRYSWEVTHA